MSPSGEEGLGSPLEAVALERGVVIAGASSLQNKLLAKLIAQATGYGCVVAAAGETRALPPGTLVLFDAAELAEGAEALCRRLHFPMVALINAPLSLASDDALFACPGLRGVFFADTSEDNLAKGIAAIFRGEYWLPRRVLNAQLERMRGGAPVPGSAATPLLTRKELETLTLLATGRSTRHIAQALKVSPHTVKTHIYNLFRKLKVRNRVQAAHWASQHLALPGLRAR